MSTEHIAAQALLARALRDRGAQVQLEAVIASQVGDRRIDVMASPMGRPEIRVAIEIQKSEVTVELIQARTRSYQTEKVAPLWLRLFDFGDWPDPKVLVERQTIWVEKHYLRAWERWVYDHLGPFLWFMDSKTLLLWRGTFVTAASYREQNTWYDSSGEEQSAGGYYQDIVRWVELELEGPFHVSDVLLKREHLSDGRLAGRLLAPGEQVPPDGPSLRATIQHDDVYGHPQRLLEVKVDDTWRRAKLQNAPPDWRRMAE